MKKSYIVVSLCIIFFLSLFIFEKINLTTADIGRHIENGKLLVHGGEGISRSALLHTNFFSFTHPEFPFVNHHWGSGIIFYTIYIVLGFFGLSLLYSGLIIATVLILFYLFKDRLPLWVSIPTTLALIPLIADRIEVRPEGFSYLFISSTIALLYAYRQGHLNQRWLYAIPVISLFFVNMHIYFILMPCIVGAFLFETLAQRDFKKSKHLVIALIASTLALFINPYGPKGVLYPLTIFQNYGYLVVENQSIPFLVKYGIVNPNFFWWKLVTAFMLSLGFILFIKHRKSFPVALFGIALVFAVLSFSQIRHFALYGIALMPFFLHGAYLLYKPPISKESKENHIIASTITTILLIIIILIHFSPNLPWSRDWGFGLKSDVNSSIEFFKKENLRGPIFSNYDIGGYLIFHTYPKEKIFVDNRPEAYPAEFFEKVYKPIQENSETWKEELEKQNFNVIYFYRHDLTPWAQKFLISRIEDPDWAPVFVDNYTIIFVKRNPENAAIIKAYELPKSMFIVK